VLFFVPFFFFALAGLSPTRFSVGSRLPGFFRFALWGRTCQYPRMGLKTLGWVRFFLPPVTAPRWHSFTPVLISVFLQCGRLFFFRPTGGLTRRFLPCRVFFFSSTFRDLSFWNARSAFVLSYHSRGPSFFRPCTFLDFVFPFEAKIYLLLGRHCPA